MLDRLPVELIDCIAQCLFLDHSNNPLQNLNVFALVHSRLYPVAIRHLYRDVDHTALETLATPNADRKVLGRLRTAHPSSFVKSLYIDFHTKSKPQHKPLWKAISLEQRLPQEEIDYNSALSPELTPVVARIKGAICNLAENDRRNGTSGLNKLVVVFKPFELSFVEVFEGIDFGKLQITELQLHSVCTKGDFLRLNSLLGSLLKSTIKRFKFNFVGDKSLQMHKSSDYSPLLQTISANSPHIEDLFLQIPYTHEKSASFLIESLAQVQFRNLRNFIFLPRVCYSPPSVPKLDLSGFFQHHPTIESFTVLGVDVMELSGMDSQLPRLSHFCGALHECAAVCQGAPRTTLTSLEVRLLWPRMREGNPSVNFIRALRDGSGHKLKSLQISYNPRWFQLMTNSALAEAEWLAFPEYQEILRSCPNLTQFTTGMTMRLVILPAFYKLLADDLPLLCSVTLFIFDPNYTLSSQHRLRSDGEIALFLQSQLHPLLIRHGKNAVLVTAAVMTGTAIGNREWIKVFKFRQDKMYKQVFTPSEIV